MNYLNRMFFKRILIATLLSMNLCLAEEINCGDQTEQYKFENILKTSYRNNLEQFLKNDFPKIFPKKICLNDEKQYYYNRINNDVVYCKNAICLKPFYNCYEIDNARKFIKSLTLNINKKNQDYTNSAIQNLWVSIDEKGNLNSNYKDVLEQLSKSNERLFDNFNTLFLNDDKLKENHKYILLDIVSTYSAKTLAVDYQCKVEKAYQEYDKKQNQEFIQDYNPNGREYREPFLQSMKHFNIIYNLNNKLYIENKVNFELSLFEKQYLKEIAFLKEQYKNADDDFDLTALELDNAILHNELKIQNLKKSQ
ncbi:hypothetical protein [Campylobacter canadensis]|uniref:hypothetical protein n=1 Tax=Campylobacter canadensis TaxID=449520 RepID=UPI001CD02F4F|nr:hypothetical protein [Campylobacter canadensis]MBZ8002361.1 hypothetical protein [Campylobacter canadensis]